MTFDEWFEKHYGTSEFAHAFIKPGMKRCWDDAQKEVCDDRE